MFSHGFYFDGAIYGGHNVYSSSRAALGGIANGGTSGAEFSTFAGAGYDWHVGKLTIGPIASLQYKAAEIAQATMARKGIDVSFCRKEAADPKAVFLVPVSDHPSHIPSHQTWLDLESNIDTDSKQHKLCRWIP